METELKVEVVVDCAVVVSDSVFRVTVLNSVELSVKMMYALISTEDMSLSGDVQFAVF